MSASLFIILLETFTFQSLANSLVCKDVTSRLSPSNDDATVSVGCPSTHPTLTNCGYDVYPPGKSTSRDGSYIQSNKCYARNGANNRGIWAEARCCKIAGAQCYDKTGTVKNDDAIVQIQCNSNDKLFGCTATNPWSDFDGAFFGTIRPDRAEYNTDYNLVSTCSVQGSGSTTTGYARCCKGFQYPPTCKIRYGSPSKVSSVGCSSGYTMVGCSVFTLWDNTNGAYVIDNICYGASGNNNNVWTSAVCCRDNAPPPTPAPTAPTTKAPTYPPFCKNCNQCSQETQPIPRELVPKRYIYILSGLIGFLICALIYVSNKWYKVSKNNKRKYSKVYDFDSQDMENESVKN